MNGYESQLREMEIFKVPLTTSPNSHPTPLLTSPLKEEEPSPLPFKGRVGVGMGWLVRQNFISGILVISNSLSTNYA